MGGYRKKLLMEDKGFNTKVLAEDTELTYRLAVRGWKVVYDNSAECYEESPETWKMRGTQVRRWSRGHNNVMFRYFFKVLTTPNLRFWKRVDAMMLLCVYAMPLVLALGFLDCIALFFLGQMQLLDGWWVLLFVGFYNAWGNFAPFYEIAAGALLDGMKQELLYLPMLCFSFYFYMWHICGGFFGALLDIITQKKVNWAKTERYIPNNQSEEQEA